MDEYCYYICKDVVSSKKEGELVCGIRIFAIPTNFPINTFADGEGPYFNLAYLIKNSEIYEDLRKVNSKRANKIILDKNIVRIAENVLIPKDTSLHQEFIQSIQHAIVGDVKNGKLTGIHFFNKKRMNVIEYLDSNDKGVWSALIEVKVQNGEWIKKQRATNFFPDEWDKTTVINELLHAVKNKRKKINSLNLYEAETLSGIIVEIVIVNNVIKTIYPIL